MIKKITEAELEVLKVAWEKGEPISSKEINERLIASKNWEKSTIRTLVYRLVDKGALHQVKEEVYYYTPTFTEKEYLEEETKSFVNKFYKGSAKNLVATLFEQESIDSNDLDELKQLWASQKE